MRDYQRRLHRRQPLFLYLHSGCTTKARHDTGLSSPPLCRVAHDGVVFG